MDLSNPAATAISARLLETWSRACRGVADEFVVRHVRARRLEGDAGEVALRVVDRIEGTLHVDRRGLRASLRFTQPADASPDVVRTLATEALRQPGPAWRLPLPSAPARVALFDPALAALSIHDVAQTLAAATDRVSSSPVRRFAVATVGTAVRVSNGFAFDWIETTAVVEREVAVAVRRLSDLRALTRWPAGWPAPPTTGAVGATTFDHATLLVDAHAHAGGGVWAPLWHHAETMPQRDGFSRLWLGQPLVLGADTTTSPITITSDGTHDFAVGSMPVGADGEGARRIELVRGGRVAAAGSVTNIVVNQGPDDLAVLVAAGPVVQRWRSWWLDWASGDFVGEVADGWQGGRALPPGTRVTGNAFTVMGLGDRSRERAWRGPLWVPVALRAPMQVVVPG